MTNVEKLINLMEENPNLPVLPMVDYEIVGEDWGRWMGSFGDSYVGEYALYDYRYFEDRDDFKDCYYDNNVDELCERFGYNPAISEYTMKIGRYTKQQLEINKANEKVMDDFLDRIANNYFIKAIIVDINMPV